MSGRELVQAVAFAVGFTFATSGFAKLRDPRAFARGVARYGLLPYSVSGVLAAVVIALELTVAAALVSGLGLLWASIAALALLAGFAVAVAVNLGRGVELPCMCFGSTTEERISGWSLIRIALLAFGVLFVLAEHRMTWFGGHGQRGRDVFLSLTVGLAIVAISRWFLATPALRGFIAEARRR
jgi:uncharacterized membrane protein YphA (DoxX/SURF4 family)